MSKVKLDGFEFEFTPTAARWTHKATGVMVTTGRNVGSFIVENSDEVIVVCGLYSTSRAFARAFSLISKARRKKTSKKKSVGCK